MYISRKIFVIFFMLLNSFLYGSEFLYLLEPSAFNDFFYPSHSLSSLNYARTSVYFFRWNDYEEYVNLELYYKSFSFEAFSHQIESPYIDENGDSLGMYTIGQYYVSAGVYKGNSRDVYGINLKFAYEIIDTVKSLHPFIDIYMKTGIGRFIFGVNIKNFSVGMDDYPPTNISFYSLVNLWHFSFLENISYSYYRSFSSQSMVIWNTYDFIRIGGGWYLSSIIKRIVFDISFNFFNAEVSVGYVMECGEGPYKRDVKGIAIRYDLK